MNTNFAADCAALEAKGFIWTTTIPSGEDKGKVISKHRTYAAAEKAAKGKDLRISDVRAAGFVAVR